MRIMNNISAMNAHRLYTNNNSKLSKSLEKLSSGYAINRAGDNAAGLAVSEKMRAQIAGLEQASKNAQDGISMVQTFEGALTETDSILQRMRSLAVQSANGTYDNSVDRVAIEQEFCQLKDELNQIADTDFNGVVVLNGGTMADGLKATEDGVFDYANKPAQIFAQANKDIDAEIEAARKAYNAASTAFEKDNYDLSEGEEWNTVDNNRYTKTAADTLWKALKLTENGEATGIVDADKYSSADITFKVTKNETTGALTWAVDSAKDNLGNDITAAATAAVTGITSRAATADTTGEGGFTFTAGGVDFNAEFDATTAKTGDTVTLRFTNSPNTNKAPTNIAIEDNSFKVTAQGGEPIKVTAPTAASSTITNTVITDAKMDAAFDAIFKAIDGAVVNGEIKKGGVVLDDTAGKSTITFAGSDTATNLKVDDNGQDYTISYKDDNGNDATAHVWITAKDDGTLEFATSEYDSANSKWVKDTAFATIGSYTASGGTAAGEAIGIEYEISLDTFKYSPLASKPTVMAGDNKALGTSNDAKAKKDAAEAALNALQAKKNTFGMEGDGYEAAKLYLAEKGVSMPNAFDKSTAKLTYNDGMSLQVGARTKDLVDFTFDYSADGIGELNADLNCTSLGLGLEAGSYETEDGETITVGESLSLATQESANEAIDKIDHAINKISMVRGTFGAIQNRLEHKINNLDTNHENLSAAESRIRDTDMAAEMMEFTKNQILSQASQSMLAQANQLPQGVLSLLQ